MAKDLEYYLRLPYTRELIREESGIWFVRIKELPYCMSQGNTPEEALRNIEEAMIGWIKGELEDGEAIPEPREEEEFSGKFNTRVPKSLHRKLVEAAERDDVSLNQWINNALAEAVGAAFARTPERLAPSVSEADESSWPGLPEAARRVLEEVGMRHTAGAADERLFAGWLEQNLEEIRAECEREFFDEALSKTRAFGALIEEHSARSPILHALVIAIASQTGLLEQIGAIEQRTLVAVAEQMQAQISTLIGAVNQPTVGRVRELEKERHSTMTTRPTVPVSAREFGPGGEW